MRIGKKSIFLMIAKFAGPIFSIEMNVGQEFFNKDPIV